MLSLGQIMGILDDTNTVDGQINVLMALFKNKAISRDDFLLVARDYLNDMYYRAEEDDKIYWTNVEWKFLKMCCLESGKQYDENKSNDIIVD